MKLPQALRGLPRKGAIALHNHRIIGIAKTTSAAVAPLGPLYAGMTCHRDALAWLVAVKSVAHAVGPGQFIALDDGSLTGSDRALLARHLPGLRIVAIAEVDTGACPRGGTWERLLAILDLSAERYVIQVDSDLVALGPLDEVAEAVRENRGFTLSGEKSSVLHSATAAAAAARLQTYPHIQHDAERLLAELPDAEGLRYARGCSGFAGFPRGGSRAPAVAFSRFMMERFGARWSDWGTEQITSNFVIANGPAPVLLPWDRYPAFNGTNQDLSAAKLIHFIGRYRFDGGVYARASQTAIAALSAH